jgi:polysaccharide deacetylase family protein (PEP-CTERM system associated)
MHGLSFDVEDWHQIVRTRVHGAPARPSNELDRHLHAILDFCDEARVKATFFVVGDVARSGGPLVLEIARRGHEIGCHSDRHRLISRLNRQEFYDDTATAKNRLEDLVGNPVLGYRAPEFSVGSLDHWCFSVLAELGFEYDSSVFPVRGPRYGIPEAPPWPFVTKTPSGELIELPLLSLRVGPRRIPAAGGTWYRLLPSGLLSCAVEKAEAEGGQGILYFHPYEFADGPLWLEGDGLSNLRALRYIVPHNVGTGTIKRKLAHVLRRHDFGRLDSIARARGTSASQRENGHDHHG